MIELIHAILCIVKKLESISDCLVCAGTNCAMNHNSWMQRDPDLRLLDEI